MYPSVPTLRYGTSGHDNLPPTLQTFPKQLPTKTTTQESYVKAIISMYQEGFGIVSIGVKEKPSAWEGYKIYWAASSMLSPAVSKKQTN